MCDPVVTKVVMVSEIEEERIRGIQYAHDPSRLLFLDSRAALFRGDHRIHVVLMDSGDKWCCDCRAFDRLQPQWVCRHLIAMERIVLSCTTDPVMGAQCGAAHSMPRLTVSAVEDAPVTKSTQEPTENLSGPRAQQSAQIRCADTASCMVRGYV